MNEELPPLSDDLAALLSKAAPVVPPQGFADQAWSQLDLGPLAAGVTAAATGAGASSVAKGLAGAKLLIAGTVAVAIGAGGGVALDRTVFKPKPEVVVREVVKEVRVEVPVPVEVKVPVPEPVRPVPHAPRHAEAAPPVAVPAPPPPPTPAELDAQLREERALLEVARTALSRANPAEAVAKLEEHQRRFPSGRLAEERDALMVNALDKLGQHDQAKAKAHEFLQRYPESLLAPQVKRFQ